MGQDDRALSAKIRKCSKTVFLLIDIRHEPGANDKQMYEWIVHNGFRSDHHCYKAGQDQSFSGAEADQADQRNTKGLSREH